MKSPTSWFSMRQTSANCLSPSISRLRNETISIEKRKHMNDNGNTCVKVFGCCALFKIAHQSQGFRFSNASLHDDGKRFQWFSTKKSIMYKSANHPKSFNNIRRRSTMLYPSDFITINNKIASGHQVGRRESPGSMLLLGDPHDRKIRINFSRYKIQNTWKSRLLTNQESTYSKISKTLWLNTSDHQLLDELPELCEILLTNDD